jgi:HAD superfamily hydrolase (TIGR01509 family)
MKPLPNPLRAVIFDWDGTLLDSFHADSAAYRKMFAAVGVKWNPEKLARHYSPDWYRVYRAVGIPRSRWAEADALWAQAYRRERPALLPGARRVLNQLRRRYTLALVSSGNRARVVRQLRAFCLAKHFSVRICAEDAQRRKPHPAPLRQALRELRLPPEACLYVGDAPEDVQMARRAGVYVAGVLGPFPTHRRLRAAWPDVLLESVAELPGLLG